MKLKQILSEVNLKVSKKYWDSLRQIEKDYIINRFDKDGLSYCKTVITTARKQLPNFDKIYGYGIIEKDGQKYKFTGLDTKNFHKIQN